MLRSLVTSSLFQKAAFIGKLQPVFQRNLNCNRAAITKIGRSTYLRMYPATVVLQDGSTINIHYKDPRRIIKLPLDLSTLSEEERLQRLDKRKPRKKVKIEEDLGDDFSVDSYSHLWKK